jgi:hypothetical protein
MDFRSWTIWIGHLIGTSQMKKIVLIYISNLLLKLNIWCSTRWQTHMKNISFENLSYLLINDFWMVKIWSYFHKSLWVAIFVCFSNVLSQKHNFESFTWAIVHMDFVSFPLKIFKQNNDINYIKYKFSHRFGKVCWSLNMYDSKIRIIIFKKIITMSIWIIL